MDTGIGKEGYSIIGQGKIDEILSVKSTQTAGRSSEEAAGIAKFRHRKEESERKLERTEENLVRINDKIEAQSRTESKRTAGILQAELEALSGKGRWRAPPPRRPRRCSPLAAAAQELLDRDEAVRQEPAGEARISQTHAEGGRRPENRTEQALEDRDALLNVISGRTGGGPSEKRPSRQRSGMSNSRWRKMP